MSELSVESFASGPREAGAASSTRRIVAYFDHEFYVPSVNKIEHDVLDMTNGGFTNVVLCVTEKDIASRSRLVMISEIVSYMREKGLEVWADPWSVGGVFGGEGGSVFQETGEQRCLHNPKLDRLMHRWLEGAAEVGAQRVFWDEPEMKDCHDCQYGEVKFLEKYTAAAGRLALQSAVCLTADEARKHQLTEVATLPDVIEIATDPYYPNPFRQPIVTEQNRLSYIERWADYTRLAALKGGTEWHVWVQTFGIPKGRESMIDEHIDVLCRRGVGSIAVWGFGGCAAVPNFIRETDALPQEVWQRVKRAITRV
jgi:hypothetical protein